jgi:hypothetical protein
MGWLVTLILLTAQSKSLAETNPHQPYKQTWITTDGETHTVLNETTHIAPTETWWPELQFCFRDLNFAYKSDAPEQAWCYGFYACPSHKISRDCEGMQDFFCKSWACVTSNDGNWRWGVTRPDLVKFAFVNKEVSRCHDLSDLDMGCVRNKRTKKWPLPTQECQPMDVRVIWLRHLSPH